MNKLIISILGLLLAIHVSAQEKEKQSLNEFQQGKIKKYSTNGEGKSRGLKLHIKHPQSWKSLEGDRPHVVRKIVQSDNYVILNILINKLDAPLSKQEISEIFTTQGLKSLLPANSSYLDSNPNLKIEGLKAGYVDSYTVATRMNRQFHTYNRNYVLIYEEYIVMMQFMVLNKTGESVSNVKSRFQISKPLFDQVFNSIVIDNIWE